jgi:HEXXH motif-containing protein
VSIGHHEMPVEQFTALARGGGGIDAVANLVAAQHSKHVILLHAVLQAATSDYRADARFATAGYELLARVQRHKPDVAADVIRYPSVGAWALHTLRGVDVVPDSRPGGLALIAAAAAIKAEMAAEIEVPVTSGKVMLPSLGAADADGSTAVVRTSPPEVLSGRRRVAVAPGADGWRELRRIRAGSLDVLVDDLDPFRMPATDGEPTGRLPESRVAKLAAMLNDAWEVLDPGSAAEIAALVRVIVPYQAPPSGFVSTSSPEAFGSVAMSQPSDRYMCAETLVHEAQHLKLSALLDLLILLVPDNGRRYYAPWRDDPRPASGLLQGAYAFLGVSGFWRQQRHVATDPAIRHRAEAEFARWREGARLAADTLLSSGQLTSAGHEFVGEMSGILNAWQHEQVSAEALAIAQRKEDLHRERWNASNDGSAAAGTAPGLA